MSGAVLLLPMCAFMVRAGTALSLCVPSEQVVIHAYICDLFRLIAPTQGIILNNTTGLTNI